MPSTGEDRLDRIERLVQQDAENIHRLATVAEAHQAEIERVHLSIVELRDTVTQLVREWQAYVRRQPAQ